MLSQTSDTDDDEYESEVPATLAATNDTMDGHIPRQNRSTHAGGPHDTLPSHLCRLACMQMATGTQMRQRAACRLLHAMHPNRHLVMRTCSHQPDVRAHNLAGR